MDNNLQSAIRESIDTFSHDQQLKDNLAAFLAQKLEEKNVTILPYKLGDKLYRACSWLAEPDELTVSMITIKKDGSFKIRMSSSQHKAVQDFTLEQIADPRYDIYASREAAQAALEKAHELRMERVKNMLKK